MHVFATLSICLFPSLYCFQVFHDQLVQWHYQLVQWHYPTYTVALSNILQLLYDDFQTEITIVLCMPFSFTHA